MKKSDGRVGWVCLESHPCSCDEWGCWYCAITEKYEKKLRQLKLARIAELRLTEVKREKANRPIAYNGEKELLHVDGFCGPSCGYPKARKK